MMESTPELRKSTELENCSFCKMALMICVLLYHSVIFWKGNWFTRNPVEESIILGHIADWLNSFHIYGFTLISGYLFYYVKYEKEGYSSIGVFIRKKVRRLLIPYVFICVCWVVPVNCFFFKVGIKELVYKYLLATSPSQLWFLIMLFGTFCIAFVMSDFWKKEKDLLGLLFSLGLYCVGVIGNAVCPNVFQIWTICQYVLYFWIGFEIRKNGSTWIRKIPAMVWVITHILICMCVYILKENNGLLFKLLEVGANLILHVIGAMMAFVTLQRGAEHLSTKSSIIRILSKYSMTIYLLHQQVIYFVIHFLNGKVTAPINAALNFGISFTVSLLISCVLHKFKITRYLVGEN